MPTDDNAVIDQLAADGKRWQVAMNNYGAYVTDTGLTVPTFPTVIQNVINSANTLLQTVGYKPAVPYTAGLVLSTRDQTVSYNGATYAAIASALPFTASGTFEADKFYALAGLPSSQVLALGGLFDPTFDGAVGNGVTDDTVAVLATAARGKIVAINKPTRVSGTQNIGRVHFGPNGRLVAAVGSSITLTIDGDPMGQQIFDITSGGAFHLAQQWIRPDWFGDIERSVIIAALALPVFGGEVHMLQRRYKMQRTVFDGYQLNKDNITLLGTGTPRFNYDCTAIEGSTVIEGRFNVFAHGFRHENIGYDLGKQVCDQYYPGMTTHAPDHPDGTTWDAFAFGVPSGFAGTEPRRGYVARNIRGLLRDPQTVGHAILQEGMADGDAQNVYGCGGVHAFVIKSMFFKARNCGGYGASENQIIVKADSYALSRSVNLIDFDTDFFPPGCVGHWGHYESLNGLHLQAAASNLGQVKVFGGSVRGSQNLFHTTGGAGFSIADLQMDGNTFDGYGVVGESVGMKFEAEKHLRMQLGHNIVNNVTHIVSAIQYEPLGTEEFSFDSIKATNWTGMLVTALNQARIRIGELSGTNGNNVYYEESTSRILVGKERFLNVTGGKFNTTAGSGIPTTGYILQSGWTSNSSNPLVLKKENFGMLAVGSLSRATGADVTMALLPSFLRPQADERTAISLLGGPKFTPAVLVIAPNGIFAIDSAMPAETSYVAVGHAAWEVV